MSENVVLGFVHPDYDHIEVLNHLGGTGDLFKAHKKGMDIEVVIKRVQPQFQHMMDQESESSILKNLKHQYLPRIYDVIYGTDGCIYTVMDLISGKNLQQHVETNGPISQKDCYRWACQLCEVVDYLHQETREKPAIIHCDIKPGNVMITDSGNVCLIDFNTSLIFKKDRASVGVTDGYAAPEQYQAKAAPADRPFKGPLPQVPTEAMPGGTMPMQGGLATGTMPMQAAYADGTVPMPQGGGATAVMEPGADAQGGTVVMPQPDARPKQTAAAAVQSGYGPISKATDIYAIGATLYYAVTGHHPEKSLGNVTPLAQYKPHISLPMQTIIQRAMQKQQAKRFQQASEMLRALHDIAQMDRGYKSYKLQKRVISLVLAGCFAASAYSCWYGFERMKTDRENTYLLSLAQAEQKEQNMEYSAAQTLLDEAIRQQPGRIEGYLQRAVLLYHMGDYQGAIDQLDSALSSGSLEEKNLDSVSVEQLHYIKGNCYIELKDYDSAVQELRQAVQVTGAGTDSYRSFAIALANAGKVDEAQKALDNLRSRNAASGDCDLVAAEIAVTQKEYAQALTLYKQVFDEVEDAQLLSHAYLSAANAALQMDDTDQAVSILEQGRTVLTDSQAVLQTEMLADVYIQQAMARKDEAKPLYTKAKQLLTELVDAGYGTISTKLNLATVLQALDEHKQAQQLLAELSEQYPTDYRFDMQQAYLLIDWQGTLATDKRDYTQVQTLYESALEKYRQAQANGVEDAQMTVLKNLVDQLHTSGWLK